MAVLSKFALTSGSTYYAQGGISAVFDANDSIESHLNDTLNAGAGLCDTDIVELTVKHGKESIDWLREQGFLDEVVREPLGGAHRDFKTMGENLKETLVRHLDSIQQQDMQTILATRYQRIMSFGVFEESSK